MYKVYFITFGCKVNHYETECMKKAFTDSGFEILHSQEEADAIVINSCTVTSSGDSRVLTALRKVRNSLPNAVIALTGCYPQANREEAENSYFKIISDYAGSIYTVEARKRMRALRNGTDE